MENGRFDFPADFDLEYVLKGSATDLGDSTVFLQTSGTYPGDPFVRIELGKKSAEFALIYSCDRCRNKATASGLYDQRRRS
jgi:hypothetical protein